MSTFKVGNIVEFIPDISAQGGRNLSNFYQKKFEIVKIKIKGEFDPIALLKDLESGKAFATKNGNRTNLFNNSKYEGFYLWRLRKILYSQLEKIPEDPILVRINKLYKKCKTTKHWEINTQKQEI